MLYSELQCSEAIHKAVERMGFAEMTEIQEKTIPVMLAGRDVIAKAPTGTGKTCAFGIPVAEHIDPEKKYPQAVIMAPTRELAQQIAEEHQAKCTGTRTRPWFLRQERAGARVPHSLRNCSHI